VAAMGTPPLVTISYTAVGAAAPLSVKIETAHAVVGRGKAQIKLACRGAASGRACHGSLSLTLRKRIGARSKTIVLARVGYSLVAGKSITLRLTVAGKRLLAHAHHHRLRVLATATVSGGSTTHRAISLQVKR